MLKKYIGDKDFYRRVLIIAIPIIIQNGITHFVSLLDNIMVGQLGNPQMSGVSIANQLIMVCNLCIWGASSGAGIFTAQFCGNDDQDGIRHTFRYKTILLTLISLLTVGILLPAGNSLIRLFLTGDGSIEDANLTLEYGWDYLNIMLIGILPFALSNVYASTLRECGHTSVPMIAGVAAVFVNLMFNYILIFGHLGAPAMGVRGAAIATVLSRFVELFIVALWTHINPKKNPFIKGVFRSFYIPGSLCKDILITGMPLLLNEFLWSLGGAILNQSYSTCGLDVINAVNITSTVNNLANVVTMSMGNTVGIIIGNYIGSGMDKDKIYDANRKLLALSVVAGTVFAVVLAAISGVFPKFYNTTESIRHMATILILLVAVQKPFYSYSFSSYFALRAGGHTWITFFFDGGYMCFVSVPVSIILTRLTNMPIYPVFFICQLTDSVKCILAYFLLKKGTWMKRII